VPPGAVPPAPDAPLVAPDPEEPPFDVPPGPLGFEPPFSSLQAIMQTKSAALNPNTSSFVRCIARTINTELRAMESTARLRDDVTSS
jgi:hypothetical protein